MEWSLLLPASWNPLISFYLLVAQESEIATRALSALFIQVIIFIIIIFGVLAIAQTILSMFKTRRYLRRLHGAEKPIATIRSSNLPLFQEFKPHILEVPKLDGSGDATERRSVDAAEIFRDTVLAPGFTESRLFLAMPSILTGLGVLGTFIGLQIGMGGLDLTDVRNLETSVVPLIQGCVVAFSTSVWGVLASLFFSSLEKGLEGLALQWIRKLQNQVNALIPRYVPEEAMANIARTTQSTEEILKGLAVAIGDQMQQAIGKLGSEIKDAVTKATAEGQGPLAEKSAELLSNALTAELGKIEAQVGRIEPSVKSLVDTVNLEQDVVRQAVGKLNAHEAVMEKMGLAATEIKNAAEAFADTKETMALSAENNKKAAQAQLYATKANKQVAEKFDHIGDQLPDIQKTLDEAARVIVSISAPLAELKSYLEKLPEEQKEFQDAINLKNSEQTGNLLSKIDVLAEKVTNAAEQFSKVEGMSSNLKEASEKLGVAAIDLEEFQNHILDASKEQKDASNSARSAALAGERTAVALESIIDDIAELTNGLYQSGDRVKASAESARDAYKELASHQKKWLEGVDVGLNSIRERLQSIINAYGQQIEGQTRNLMNQWTSEVNKCLASYQTQVDQLQGDLDELNSFLNKLNGY